MSVTAVDFATTAATSFTVQSSTQIQAVVPAINNETVGDIYNVTVTTGAGVSAKATANQWYWFGAGSCAFSGTGVENSGAPPGASAYIQDAVAGTSSTNPSGGTVIPTTCTGLEGLGTTGADARVAGGAHGGRRHRDRARRGTAATRSGSAGRARTATRPRSDGTYNAPSPGFQLPESGPSTTGGCPVPSSLCLSAAAGGNADVLRHRPQRDLPTITGHDRRRARRLRRDGPDGAVGLASGQLRRGHLAALLRQRPDAGPGHGHVHVGNDGSRRHRHPQQLQHL